MTDIIFILDESASMRRHSDSYISGINAFINTQKQFNPYSSFTMVKFNSNITTLCVDSKMYTLPELTREHYKPDGITAMYDAIGHVINLKYDETIRKNTVVFILTDGEDNHSRKFTQSMIGDTINYMKERGWTFVYIATDHNARKFGERMNVNTCLSYSESNTSIARIAEACNIAIGHAVARWTGNENQFSQKEMPVDISDLMNNLSI
jgi:hypothetical protein